MSATRRGKFLVDCREIRRRVPGIAVEVMAVEDAQVTRIHTLVDPDRAVTGVDLVAERPPGIDAVDPRPPEEKHGPPSDAQEGGMVGVGVQRMAQRGGHVAASAVKGRVGLEEDANLETARRSLFQQGLEVFLGRVAARSIPGHQERVDAGSLRLFNVTAHDGPVTTHIRLRREVAQLVETPTVFVIPGIVDGEDEGIAADLAGGMAQRRRLHGAEQEAEDDDQRQQQHRDQDTPAKARRGGRAFSRC